MAEVLSLTRGKGTPEAKQATKPRLQNPDKRCRERRLWNPIIRKGVSSSAVVTPFCQCSSLEDDVARQVNEPTKNNAIDYESDMSDTSESLTRPDDPTGRSGFKWLAEAGKRKPMSSCWRPGFRKNPRAIMVSRSVDHSEGI